VACFTVLLGTGEVHTVRCGVEELRTVIREIRLGRVNSFGRGGGERQFGTEITSELERRGVITELASATRPGNSWNRALTRGVTIAQYSTARSGSASASRPQVLPSGNVIF
jgi:hypothetical protein